MGNQAYPTVGQFECSWADLTVTAKVGGGGALIDTADIAALNFSDSIEEGERRGTSGGRRMSRTVGAVSNEGSITFYMGGLRKLVREMAKLAPTRGVQKRVGLVTFDIGAQFTPVGDTEIYTFSLRGIRLLGRSWALAEGNEAQKIEVPISIMEIVEIVDGDEIVLL